MNVHVMNVRLQGETNKLQWNGDRCASLKKSSRCPPGEARAPAVACRFRAPFSQKKCRRNRQSWAN